MIFELRESGWSESEDREDGGPSAAVDCGNVSSIPHSFVDERVVAKAGSRSGYDSPSFHSRALSTEEVGRP